MPRSRCFEAPFLLHPGEICRKGLDKLLQSVYNFMHKGKDVFRDLRIKEGVFLLFWGREKK